MRNTEPLFAAGSSRYRPEIDGLRAFAVLAVIINHFNKAILPGGFLGVDIFFVISGYVITSSLFKRPTKDFKDFISGFYERRVKRLLPALLVFVLITSIVLCLFNPSPGLSLQTGLASLFGLSNLYLFSKSTDYFSSSTELNVFTHTWSLGVEEQFYLLFPFFIWFSGFGRQTKNGSRNLFLIISLLASVSLVAFLYWYPVNHAAGYFLMPSRFWEMATGCLIFIAFQKRAFAEQILQKIPPGLLFALIVAVMFLPISLARSSTIAVVALSSLLINSLEEHTALYKVFSSSGVVYIGLISYSLYLWHWGVLSISRWTIGIHWWSVPFQIIMMFGLAIASYRWIETPSRRSSWFRSRWKTLVLGGGLLTIVSAILFGLGKYISNLVYTGHASVIKTYSSYPHSFISNFNGKLCHNADLPRERFYANCVVTSDPNQNTIYLVGDSHAWANIAAATKVAKDFSLNFASYTWNGLPFPVVKYKRIDDKTILSPQVIETAKILEQEIITNSKPGDIVLIFMRFDYHFGDQWLDLAETDPRAFLYPDSNGNFYSLPTKKLHLQKWKVRLEDFIEKMTALDVNVVISTPTPIFPLQELGVETYKQCNGFNRQWFNVLQQSKDCVIDSHVFDGNVGRFARIIKYLSGLESLHSNVFILDSFDSFCGTNSQCIFSDNNNSYFRDMDHLSNYGSLQKVYPALHRLLRSNRLVE